MTDQERLEAIKGNWEYEKCIKPEDVELLLETVEEQQKEINGLFWRNKWLKSQEENARLRETMIKAIDEISCGISLGEHECNAIDIIYEALEGEE